MSVRISLDKLNEQQRKLIREYLYLQPKNMNFMQNKFNQTSKDPILLFWVDKPNNQIILPYTFANSLFGYHVNTNIEYPLSKYNFLGKLRDYQVPIIDQALSQLKEKGTTTLLLGTGAGKSIISACLGSHLEGIVLILVNRETIQKGWVETFAKETDAKVWVIESRLKIPQECNVIITMDGKFEKIPWAIRKMVSVLVIDESHMFCTATQVPVLLGTQPKYIIACTATLERPDDMHQMIYLIAGTHNVQYKSDKFFSVYRLFTGIETEIGVTKQGSSDWPKLVKDLAFNPIRNAFIIDLIEKNKDHKIMVLTWNADHVNFLTDLLKERGESVDKLVGNKSKYIDSRVLIGTLSKVSTGFDAKNVATDWDGADIDMLILAGSTKSHNLHIQSVGRAFRASNPTIIDIVDDNRISKSHWNARRKNYEQENCKIYYSEMKNGAGELKDLAKQDNITDIHLSKLAELQDKYKDRV